MPISSQAYVPKVGIGATTPKITNLVIATPATEESHALNGNLRSLVIRARDRVQLQIAFTATESATKYITLNAGAVLSLDSLEFDSKTIYIQSDTATTVEILELHN